MKNFSMLKTVYKAKEFEFCFCQYLKNNIPDIRLIPLDHATYSKFLKSVKAQNFENRDMHPHPRGSVN